LRASAARDTHNGGVGGVLLLLVVRRLLRRRPAADKGHNREDARGYGHRSQRKHAAVLKQRHRSRVLR